MIHQLKNYVGRSAVFIENGLACAATVVSAESRISGIKAAFRLLPATFMCRLRLVRSPGDDPIEQVLEECPFGDQWQVEVSNQEFLREEEHWQASFLWGGGFRIFFQPPLVSRFLSGDVTWLEEFYSDDEEESEEDWERNWLWLGLDKFERIGVFQSYGDAALPASLQASFQDALSVDEFIAAELFTGASYCQGQLSRAVATRGWRARFPADKYQKHWDDYLAGMIKTAARGLFIYDPGQSAQRPKGYYQVAFPSKPLPLAMIPPAIREIISRTRFPHHSFADADDLGPEVIASA